MLGAIALLSGVALLGQFVRGMTGAGSAIVFNAMFVILFSFGWTAGLTLHEGLYWMAIANAFGALVMGGSLRHSLHLDRLTALFLLGMLPSSAVFAFALTRMEGSDLALLLAVVVTASGIYLAAKPRPAPADPARLRKVAFPVGLASGVIGGLYGMGGPISFLLFSAADPHDTSLFRARLTMVTLGSNFLRLAVLASQGVYTTERVVMAGATLPAVLLGIFVGMWTHRFVKPGPFRAVLGTLIAIAGIVALVQWLWLD